MHCGWYLVYYRMLMSDSIHTNTPEFLPGVIGDDNYAVELGECLPTRCHAVDEDHVEQILKSIYIRVVLDL